MTIYPQGGVPLPRADLRTLQPGPGLPASAMRRTSRRPSSARDSSPDCATRPTCPGSSPGCCGARPVNASLDELRHRAPAARQGDDRPGAVHGPPDHAEQPHQGLARARHGARAAGRAVVSRGTSTSWGSSRRTASARGCSHRPAVVGRAARLLLPQGLLRAADGAIALSDDVLGDRFVLLGCGVDPLAASRRVGAARVARGRRRDRPCRAARQRGARWPGP